MLPQIFSSTPKKLPNPATTQDEFAYATVIELRRLNDNFERLLTVIDEMTITTEPSDEIDLREPALPDAVQDADAPLTVETVDLVEPEPEKKPVHRDAKKATGKATEAE